MDPTVEDKDPEGNQSTKESSRSHNEETSNRVTSTENENIPVETKHSKLSLRSWFGWSHNEETPNSVTSTENENIPVETKKGISLESWFGWGKKTEEPNAEEPSESKSKPTDLPRALPHPSEKMEKIQKGAMGSADVSKPPKPPPASADASAEVLSAVADGTPATKSKGLCKCAPDKDHRYFPPSPPRKATKGLEDYGDDEDQFLTHRPCSSSETRYSRWCQLWVSTCEPPDAKNVSPEAKEIWSRICPQPESVIKQNEKKKHVQEADDGTPSDPQQTEQEKIDETEEHYERYSRTSVD